MALQVHTIVLLDERDEETPQLEVFHGVNDRCAIEALYQFFQQDENSSFNYPRYASLVVLDTCQAFEDLHRWVFHYLPAGMNCTASVRKLNGT